MDNTMNLDSIIVSFFSIVNTIQITDIIDILIMTFIIYNVILLLRNTRTLQVLNAILLVFVVYVVATQVGLKSVSFMITSLSQVSLLVIVIVFQGEIKRLIERFGRTNVLSLAGLKRKTAQEIEIEDMKKAVASICDAAQKLSDNRVGGLIVMEKFSNIDEVIKTGTVINADISSEIINTIFYNGTPLHDGALIISDKRINTAGCVLPLSDNLEISKDMGTRHRAALGLSENSDAVIIVISEETGYISIAKNGELKRRLDKKSLYSMLSRDFVQPLEDSFSKQQKIETRSKLNAEK